MNEDNESAAWAQNLAKALKTWGGQNGFPYLSFLQRELEIKDTVWTPLAAGRVISKDVEVYAKLYLRTGLDAANPTTIPDRMGKVPQGGTIRTKRAWSQRQLDDWIAGAPQKYRPVTTGSDNEEQKTFETTVEEPAAVAALPKPSLSTEHEGDMLAAGLLSLLARHNSQLVAEVSAEVVTQLEPMLVRILTKILGQQSSPTSFSSAPSGAHESLSLSELASLLTEKIVSAASAGDEPLSRLVRESGNALGRLLPVLDAATSHASVRRQKLENIMELPL